MDLKILGIIQLIITFWITTKEESDYLLYFDMIQIVDQQTDSEQLKIFIENIMGKIDSH